MRQRDKKSGWASAASLLRMLAACLVVCIAFWAVRNIQDISFNPATGGKPLKALAQKTRAMLPDFMSKIGYARASAPALSMGMYILAACGTLLGLLSKKGVRLPEPIVSQPRLPWRYGAAARLCASGAGWSCLIILLMRVSTSRGCGKDILLWLAASLFFWMVVADRQSERLKSLLSCAEWSLLCTAVAVCAAFYMWHATWWFYSCMGDEYAFLGAAMRIVSGLRDDPFLQLGVYGDHPVMISFAQVAVMKVFGENNFGWRASSALFAAGCFIPFYYFMRYYFSRVPAVIGTGVMACSHYLTTWARLGKPHNNGIIFYCLALGLYAYFRRRPSRSRAYLCGAVMGGGFYFNHTAKFAVVIFLILYVVDALRERALRRSNYVLSFFIGFLIIIAPSVCHPRTYEVFKSASYLTAPEAAVGYRIRNSVYLLCAPICYPWIGDFIFRSIMDSLSAALFALGLCWSILWAFRRRQFFALVVTFFMSLLLIGGFNPYGYPKTTRAFFVFPWWAAFAGIGAWRVLELISSGRKGRGGFCVALLAIILVLNLRRLYLIVPPIYDFIAPEALVLKEFQCELRPEVHAFSIGGEEDKVPVAHLDNIMRLYGYKSRWHVLKNRTLANPDFSERIIRPALLIVDGRNKDKDRVLAEMRRIFSGCKEKHSVATWGMVSLDMFYIEGEGISKNGVRATNCSRGAADSHSHHQVPRATPEG